MISGLRFVSCVAILISLWLVWPRELDGLSLGRDGRLAVPDYALNGLRYVSVKKGAIELEATAEEASYDLARQIMLAQRVRSYLYNEKGERTLVQGDRAQFFQTKRQLQLAGNVKSLSPDGLEMDSNEASYFLENRFLVAKGGVTGVHSAERLKMWGDRAETRMDEGVVNLFGNARAEYEQPRQGVTKLKGDTARLDRDAQRAEFFENVQVEQPKMKGTSRRASLVFDRGNREMSYLSLNDDVKIVEEGGRNTRSQVAEFFGPTNTIILSGFPAVYHGDDAVTGDRITLYRSTGVVEVTATNAAGRPEKEPASKGTPNRPLSEEDKELIP